MTGSASYRRLRNAIVTGGDITLSDRDLVLAAIEANRLRLHSCAIVALDELSLRMVSDETPEQAGAARRVSRWHDNWRDEETPEEKIERRYATVDKLGEWSGQDKPTLMDTAKRLNAIKSEYGLSGEGPDEEAMRASRAFAVDKFRELGIDYEDVHAWRASPGCSGRTC
jgi:hypothetical protein